jgi:hypothetical protein
MSLNNPNLPLELHESILSHLAPDRRMLANCALVCHAWRSIVQPWMFTKLSIKPDLIQCIWEFFRTSSASHHLSKSIKMIEIDNIPESDAYTVTIPSFSAMLGAMNERQMFQLFNNVEYLILFVFRDTLTNEDVTLLSQFRHLRKMELELPSFRDLVALSFPALSHLELSCSYDDSEPVQTQAQAQTQALNLQNLQRLAIILDNCRRFPARMKVYAPRLEHLTLLNWSHVASIARNVIDFIPPENIKTLNLCAWSQRGERIAVGKSWHSSTFPSSPNIKD